VIIDNLKCIFVHIPRTGGSSVEVALNNGHIQRCHFTAQKLKDSHHAYEGGTVRPYSAVWHKYFKFSIVRNPFDWLISLYYHPHVGSSTHYRYHSPRPGSNGPYNIVDTHPDYSETWKRENELKSDGISYPARSLEDFIKYPALFDFESDLGPESILHSVWMGDDMDYVMRFENLQEDFDCLCEKLNIPKEKLPFTGLPTERNKSYHSYYDGNPELIDAVNKRFKKDLVKFGYSYE